MKVAVYVMLAAWLFVGAVAAGQRDHYGQGASCDALGTVAANLAAGPLNYHGLDPVVSCPEPSA